MSDISALERIGYSPRWQSLFAPHADRGLAPARVVRSDRGSVLIATTDGIRRAKLSTRLQRDVEGLAGLPAVGDWVGVQTPGGADAAFIDVVLARASAIARRDPGKTSNVQVLVANVDVVFVVQPIAEPPNLRRIERELAVAWESGAVPVVLLTKADLSADPEAARGAVEAIAPGADVHALNALAGEGIAPLLGYVSGHRTAVLIGPSGAGKSTLVNALLGEHRQATREVRLSDGRGRHATVSRELIELPGGGVLIDTPGLRELGLTGSEEGIAAAFPEIEAAARECRFRDCAHRDEPDCAVRAAVESGALPAGRLASYHKLVREAQIAAAKADARLRSEENRRSKIFGRVVKEFYRRGGRG